MKVSQWDLPHLNLVRLSAFCGVYFISVRGGEFLYGSLSIPSPFWFPDSVLLCALLLSRKEDWWVWILATWPIRLLAGAPAGTPLWFLVFSVANDSLKGFLAAWWLNRLIPGRIHLMSVRQFTAFLGVAALAVPLISALLAAPARYALGDSYWSSIYRWFLGDTVAQVVVTPTVIYWLTATHRRVKRHFVEIAILATGLMAVLYYAFVIPHASFSPILIYAPVPFLIWAAVRLRPPGTANAMCLVAFVSMLSAAKGTGVFSGQTLNENLLSIQLFLLLAAVSLLFLSILVVERENRTVELEALLDAAPMSILIATGADCQDILANRAGYRLRQAILAAKGIEGSKAIERLAITSNGVTLKPQDLPLQRAIASASPITDASFTIALDDGTECHMLGNASPLLDENGNPRGAIGTFLDLTANKRAERALRESEARFRLVADTAPVLIWMSGVDKLCTYFSRTWLEFTGRTLEQELGNGWAEGVHPDDLEHCLTTYKDAFDARENFEMQYRLRRYDGEYRWVLDRGVPRFTSDGVFCGYIGSCMDETERKLSERQMQELSGRLIHAQEQERARIARELHDDLSQKMAMLEITADRFRQLVGELSPNAGRELDKLVEATAQISSDIRHLSHQLHPPVLDVLGLTPAVQGLCKEMSEQFGLVIQFVHRDVPRELPKEVGTCIFRIVQEALRNVIKHGETREAMVELTADSKHLKLLVSDTGVGFDLTKVCRDPGLGLISMRERLRPIGGTLKIETAPSSGTRIHAFVPIGSGVIKLARRSA